MPKTKIALTLDAALVEEIDALVARRRFPNRSQAVEAAVAAQMRRWARARLAHECAKAHPDEEQRLAEESLVDALDAWPAYCEAKSAGRT
jgi:Arc/MetJ-type ribon-helix-helix transcriptional regulator